MLKKKAELKSKLRSAGGCLANRKTLPPGPYTDMHTERETSISTNTAAIHCRPIRGAFPDARGATVQGYVAHKETSSTRPLSGGLVDTVGS